MNIDVILDYGLLYLLSLLEMISYSYFLQPLEKRSGKYLINGFCLIAAAAALMLWSALSLTKISTRDIFSLRYTTGYYLILLAWIYGGYRLSIRKSLYYTNLIFLSTRAVRHLIGQLLIVLTHGDHLAMGNDWSARLLSCLVLFVVFMLIFTGLKKIVFRFESGGDDISWPHLLLNVSVVFPVMYCGAFAAPFSHANWSTGLDAVLAELVASLCGLFSILGYGWVMEVKKQENRLKNMEQLLQLQLRQYETKKETVDLINQKYHDLKKLLNRMEQISGDHKNRIDTKALQEEIKKYEMIAQTGNEMLDIVLFDKHEQCQKAGIRLLCILDGNDLSFLDPLDITAIFGNALDNAIEQAEQMEREEQREITVKVSSRPGWILIRFENDCIPDELDWKNGELQTTKGDRDIHGFGISSIRHSVQKYGGNMTIDVKNGKFILNIMFPETMDSRQQTV